MDTALTDPIPIIESEKAPRTVRPAMMVASAGLGAVMAAIVVLVWAFSSGPQSVNQPERDSAASPAKAQPAANKPSEAPPAALPDASALPAGLPAGLTQPGASSGGENPLAAFTPSASSGSRVVAPAAAWPPPPALPPPPDLQTVLDTAAPYLLPALAPSIISGDVIGSLLGDVGSWVTAAGVATANNATDLLVALIVAGPELGYFNGITGGARSLSDLMGVPQAVASLINLPTPQEALGLSAVSLPALDALGNLPSLQIGLPQLPAPPSFGFPQLPPPPAFGMPKLPPPPPIGMPKLPPPPNLSLISAFS